VSPHPTSSLLQGKRLLVTGIVTTDSIAFATAHAAIEAGAELVLTGLPRDLHLTTEAAAALPGDVPVLGADLTLPADLAAVRAAIAERWDHLDGALHAVAFAPRAALAGDLLAAGFADVSRAVEASTYSYAALAAVVRDLAPPSGASIVGLDFDAAGAWPVYNWMGVCKAGLEAVSRYVARDLGPLGIRSNLIAAGPIRTRAAGGIPDFDALLEAWEHGSPLPWDDEDARPVADAVCFLLSDLSRMISGEILHVDGGYHAMAAPLRRSDPSGEAAVRPSSEATSPVGAAR
jgi:enoyl-[acyl-carrier protein] reductase I